MASKYPTSTPPTGQYPPFAVITQTDHGAWIIISASLGTSLSILFGGIRIFIQAANGSEHGFDDWLVAVATALSVAQSSLVLFACHVGLGKSVDLLTSDSVVMIEKMYYASNLLYIVCLVLSKAAVACFILRLTPVHPHIRFLKSTLVALIAWGIGSFLMLAIVCDMWHPWLLRSQKCTGYFLRWAVLESLGSLYEVAMVGMSLWLVWSLKIGVGSKVAVITTFGSRLVLVLISCFRLHSYSKSGLLTDPTLLESRFIAWASAELNYSIISATFPIVRPFINNLATNYGGRGLHSNGYYGWPSDGYVRSTDVFGRTIAICMDSIPHDPTPQELTHLPQKCTYKTHIVGGRRATSGSALGEIDEDLSAGSNNDRNVVVRKQVTIESEWE